MATIDDFQTKNYRGHKNVFNKKLVKSFGDDV